MRSLLLSASLLLAAVAAGLRTSGSEGQSRSAPMPQQAILHGHPDWSSQGLDGPLQQPELVYLDSMVKVFPDMPEIHRHDPTTKTRDNVTLFVAGNEHAMFQFGVHKPRGDYVEFAFADFTFQPQESVSGSVQVSVKSVDWTQIDYAVNEAGRKGPFPDPLPEYAPYGAGANIDPSAKGRYFWIDVKVLESFPMTDAGQAIHIGDLATSGSAKKGHSHTNPLVVSSVPVFVVRHRFDIPTPANATQATDTGLGDGRRLFNGTRWSNPEGWKKGYLPYQMENNNATNVAYYENIKEHRVNRLVWEELLPFALPRMTVTRNLSWATLNTTTFDATVEYLLAKGFSKGFRLPNPMGCSDFVMSCPHTCPKGVHWDFFSYYLPNTPGVGGDESWSVPIFENPESAENRFKLNSTFATLFNLTFKTVIAHLESKGWLEHFAWAEFIDEPDYEDPWTLGVVTTMAKLFKGLHPKIKWSQTRFPIPQVPELMPLADAWIAHVQQVTTPGALDNMTHYKELYGTELYTYNNGIPIIDLSAVRVRAFPWAIWQTNNGAIRNQSWFNPSGGPASNRHVIQGTSHFPQKVDGLRGSLSWYSIDGWSINVSWPTPWQSGNQDPECVPPLGHCPYNAGGFGWLLYPPKNLDMSEAPVSSIRWELMLLGLQDAEYFFLLQDTILAHSGSTESITPACRTALDYGAEALFNTTQVIWGFPQVTQFVATTSVPLPYCNDTALLSETKFIVGRALDHVILNCN